MNLTNLIAFTPVQREAAHQLAALVGAGHGNSDKAKRLAAKLIDSDASTTHRKRRKGKAA